ncbi:MAG: hypothetical protein Tsb0017_18880 [Geothermobacteraceae bacterium]
MRRYLLLLPVLLLAGGMLLASLPTVTVHQGNNRIELPPGRQQFLFWLRAAQAPDGDDTSLVTAGENPLTIRILPLPGTAESLHLVWVSADRPWGLSNPEQAGLPACCRVPSDPDILPGTGPTLLLVDTDRGRTMARLDLIL